MTAKKQALSFLLAALMVIAILPFTAITIYANNVGTLEEFRDAIDRGDPIITLTNDIIIPERFSGSIWSGVYSSITT